MDDHPVALDEEEEEDRVAACSPTSRAAGSVLTS